MSGASLRSLKTNFVLFLFVYFPWF